jgi:hypothetical protein
MLAASSAEAKAMSEVQTKCTNMVYSAAFWLAVRKQMESKRDD